MKSRSVALLLTLLALVSCKNDRKDEFLETLLRQHPESFDNILANADEFEVQIIYTQIDRDPGNAPRFKSYFFNVDSTRYFYPASTVKLPMVLLSLERLRELNIPGLDANTVMLHDSVYSGQLSVANDTTSETGFPSVAHYAKKILVVSDNDAYNRLYEWIGQSETNERMKQKGYTARIVHRLERPLSLDENRHTEAVRFVKGDSVIWSQPMLVNDNAFVPPAKVLKGKGFYRRDSLVMEPFDFSYKNFLPLNEQQNILRGLLFPTSVPEKSRFHITARDRQFVLKYLSQLPREVRYPPYYTDTAYRDSFCKFLMYGTSRERIPTNIRIFNKVGDAYGYLVDNAYIVDFDKNVEFLLSAVILVNSDGIFNDSQYDYDSIGFPFMRDLGKVIYEYEVKRTRERSPDLSEFIIDRKE